MTSTASAGPRRPADPAWSWSLAARVVVPIWAAFTMLRWAVVLIVQLFPPAPTFPGTTGLRAMVGTWDAGIFLAIADTGYPLGTDPLRAAFFPGWPLLKRVVAWPLSPFAGDNALLIAGVVLTTALSLAAALLLHRIAFEQYGRSAAAWAVVLLMAWPSAGFLTALYSEGLYLVAAMGAWWLALRQRWILAGLVCGIATFTRVTGVFLCAALLVMYVTTTVRERKPFRWADVGGVLLGGWGILVFFAYLAIKTGDPLAWSHALQKGWGRATVGPWSSLQESLRLLTSPTEAGVDWRWQIAADIVIVALCIAAAVVMARRRLWPELTLTVLTIGSVVTATSYISVTRYTLGVFPLMIVGGSLLARARLPAAAATVGVSSAWMVSVMALFAFGYWAG